MLHTVPSLLPNKVRKLTVQGIWFFLFGCFVKTTISTLTSKPVCTSPENLQGKPPGRFPDQMPEPPQLTSFSEKEQRLYSDSITVFIFIFEVKWGTCYLPCIVRKHSLLMPHMSQDVNLDLYQNAHTVVLTDSRADRLLWKLEKDK